MGSSVDSVKHSNLLSSKIVSPGTTLIMLCCDGLLNSEVLRIRVHVFLKTEPRLSLSASKVYGESLLSHLKSCGQDIALPIQECVTMLLRTGLQEEVRSTYFNARHFLVMNKKFVSVTVKCFS